MKRDADLLVRNCGQLLTMKHEPRRPRRGAALADVGLVTNGTLAAFQGRIVDAGPGDSLQSTIQPVAGCREVDAGRAVVMPGFVDSHTHTVFAAHRLEEYKKRVLGVPYAEIAKEGGGIAKSVSDVRSMDERTLFEVSRNRLQNCMRYGSTTIELKSGYGLNLDNELKQLRVIRDLAAESPALIVPTFLGAHGVPEEYLHRREDYISTLINEMIPTVAGQRLAEHNDVFCEIGVFGVEEAERILRAGVAAGLKGRVHADELNDTGAAEMAVRVGAVSADHLTKISRRGITRMADSSVIGVLLPGTSFGLPSLDFAPAREMVEHGMAIAIASDFNPGSSPSESMPMMIAIACSHMGLSPEEAISAATYNASFVVERSDAVGSLEAGKRADFLILECGDYREIPYRFGINPVARVFVEGREWAPSA